MTTGYIFFDNNVLGEIHKNGLAPAIARSLRASGLQAQATELNLVESYSAPVFVSDALVSTLRILVGQDAVLPWTGEILKLEAEAFMRGERASRLPLYSLDNFEPGESREELRTRLITFKTQTDITHRELHASARPQIQAKLKEMRLRPSWDDFGAFLGEWQSMPIRRIFAARSWKDLGLADPFNPGILDASDSWRLMSDADALGLYQGAIAFDQPKEVQRMDQLQLPYLGGATRRILVTRDGAFSSAASIIVNGRYHLGLVQKMTDFFRKSGL